MKQLLAVCVISIVIATFTDNFFSLLYAKTHNPNFSKKTIRTLLDATLSSDVMETSDQLPSWMADEVLHPFVGFVYDPTKNHDANQWGWEGENPMGKRAKDDVRVVILGGSVANHMYRYSKNIIIDELKIYAKFVNKNIRIYNLSFPAYKQPQQLITLNLFLALGAEFDVVVNVDGFNEVALLYDDNIQDNITPFYPWYWQFYSQKALDTSSLSALYEVNLLRQTKQKITAIFSIYPLNDNIIPLILWRSLASKLGSRIAKINYYVAHNSTKSQHSYQIVGPQIPFKNDDEYFSYASKLWSNSSKQIAQLAESNDMLYLHFLQPNQYVENSKPFSSEEKHLSGFSIPDKDINQIKTAITKGFPLLKREGQNLASSGVHFFDLTRLYAETPNTIYIDTCCHVNQIGNDMLAKTIASYIDKYYQ